MKRQAKMETCLHNANKIPRSVKVSESQFTWLNEDTLCKVLWMNINCWCFVLTRTESVDTFTTGDPSFVCRAFRDATRKCLCRAECPLSHCLRHCASLLPRDSVDTLNFRSWVWVARRAQRIMITDLNSAAGIQGTIKKMVAFMDLLDNKDCMAHLSKETYEQFEYQRNAISKSECHGWLVALLHRVEVCMNKCTRDCANMPADLYLSVCSIVYFTNALKSGLSTNRQKCLSAQVKSRLLEFKTRLEECEPDQFGFGFNLIKFKQFESALNARFAILDGVSTTSDALAIRIADDIAKR